MHHGQQLKAFYCALVWIVVKSFTLQDNLDNYIQE